MVMFERSIDRQYHSVPPSCFKEPFEGYLLPWWGTSGEIPHHRTIPTNCAIDTRIAFLFVMSNRFCVSRDCNCLFFWGFFKIKFLADTCPFWGHWYPCFGFLVTSPVGFKVRVGFTLFTFCGGKCNVHSLRSTSVAILTNLLAAGAQTVTSSHACAEVGLGSYSNGQSPGQKTNVLPLCLRPGKIAIVIFLKLIWMRSFRVRPGSTTGFTIPHRSIYLFRFFFITLKIIDWKQCMLLLDLCREILKQPWLSWKNFCILHH